MPVLTGCPASSGLRLLPATGAPCLLPAPHGGPRPREPATAGEHLEGERPHQSPGQASQRALVLEPDRGALISGNSKLYLGVGEGPGTGVAIHSLLCRTQVQPTPRSPATHRSCWQCWGGKRWTRPRWGLQCSTSAPKPPSTGPALPGVSPAAGGGLALGMARRGGRMAGRRPRGSPGTAPRAAEATADIPVHRHLLPEQRLRVRLLLLPARLTRAGHRRPPRTAPINPSTSLAVSV